MFIDALHGRLDLVFCQNEDPYPVFSLHTLGRGVSVSAGTDDFVECVEWFLARECKEELEALG